MKSIYLTLLLFSLSIAFVYAIQVDKNNAGKTNTSAKNLISTGKASIFPGDKRTCHTMEMDALLRSRNPQMPSLDQDTEQINQLVERYKLERAQGRMQSELIIIPVVVHVIHNGEAVGTSPNISTAQVNSQIDVLNEDFRRKAGTNGFNNHAAGADIEIEFAMALIDPNGNVLTEPGINRLNKGRQFWDDDNLIESSLKPSTIWDPTKYLNMWTVDFGPESTTLGYAQFPSSSGLSGLNTNGGPAETDGLVMRYSAFGRVGDVDPTYNLGRTTTHEIGHWLGLRHIWGDGGCGVDDFCADTPLAGDANYTCDQINSCTTANDQNDMIENYMDYTPDACMNIFTNDQKTRIRAVMELSPRRKELKNSDVIGNISGALFSVSNQIYCANKGIGFTDNSTNQPTSWEWRFYDSNNNLITTSTQQNPIVSLNSFGFISVELIATGASGSSTLRKDNLFLLLTSNQLSSPWTDNIETANPLSNWYVLNPDADNVKWTLSNEASVNGIGAKSVRLDNFTNDISGTRDWLISPAINLNNISSASFSFAHAYAQYNDVADTLSVYYTSTCGASWELLWSKNGAALASAPKNSNYFIPTSSQWTSNNLDLSNLGGNTIYLAFVNGSAYGNNIFLDNFAFQSTGGGTGVVAPVANFSASNTIMCPNSTVNFTDASTNNPVSWSWLFPGGSPSSSTVQNPVVSYSSPGTYSVSLTASNAGGQNTKTQNGYITVSALPTLSISSSHPDGQCQDENITLTATVTAGSTVVWKDVDGNQVGNGNQFTYRITESQTISAVATNTSGCTNSQQFSQVMFNLPTLSSIFFNENDASLSVTTNSNDIQWYYEGEPIEGATNNIYFPDMDGNYFVDALSDEGCLTISDELFVEVLFLGTKNIKKSQLSLFPNPAQSHIQLSGLDNSKQYSVRLIDTKGSEILTQTYQNDFIDVSTLLPGLYTIVVQHDTEIFRTKLIKK